MRPAVPTHSVVEVLLKRSVHHAPALADGAPHFELAGVADRELRSVSLAPAMVVLVMKTQCLSGRAEVVIVFGIVAEMAGAKKAGVAEVEVGDRNVRPDAGFLQSRHILAGTVLGITGDLAGVAAPAEDSAPEQVEHRAILGDLRGCD